MSGAQAPPVWANVTCHILRHAQGDWWIDVWVETQGASKVARLPMCHGVTGEPVTQDDYVKVMEHMRIFVNNAIAEMIEPV